MEALVTAAGDLMAAEEVVAAEEIPSAVREAAQNEAGKDAKLRFGKKKISMTYEGAFTKDGHRHELEFDPPGGRKGEE